VFLHDVIHDRIYVFGLEIIVGEGEPQDAVPIYIVHEGHFNLVSDADDLVGDFQISHEDGLFGHGAHYLSTHIKDVKQFWEQHPGVAIFVSSVGCAPLALAVDARYPELTGACIEEHFELLGLVRVSDSLSDAYFPIIGGYPFFLKYLFFEGHVKVGELEKGNFVIPQRCQHFQVSLILF